MRDNISCDLIYQEPVGHDDVHAGRTLIFVTLFQEYKHPMIGNMPQNVLPCCFMNIAPDDRVLRKNILSCRFTNKTWSGIFMLLNIIMTCCFMNCCHNYTWWSGIIMLQEHVSRRFLKIATLRSVLQDVCKCSYHGHKIESCFKNITTTTKDANLRFSHSYRAQNRRRLWIKWQPGQMFGWTLCHACAISLKRVRLLVKHYPRGECCWQLFVFTPAFNLQ